MGPSPFPLMHPTLFVGDGANVSGIHATILPIRHSLNASAQTPMTTAPAVTG